MSANGTVAVFAKPVVSETAKDRACLKHAANFEKAGRSNTMKPSIAVVTATLNAAKVLPTLISSLRSQTDRQFDYLVIDGGSRDGTQDVIAAARDIVTYTFSQLDHGVYDALNRAIRGIEADYYLVAGADDQLAPDAIANFKAVAEETGADVVIANVKAGNRVLSGYRPKRRWHSPASMCTSHSVGTLLRTKLHDRFGPYSWRYPLIADSYYLKHLFLDPDVKVTTGDFVAGEFATNGMSNINRIRAICETWWVQRETDENPLVQFLLFQLRLLKALPTVISRR